jgi:threonine aldolase
MLRPVDAVVCAAGSHINVDEAGAAERMLGAKLIDLPAPGGKLVPDQLAELGYLIDNEHHAQPAVVSITQSTELGTVYTPDEVAAVCDRAHAMGMRVHMDGARIANATAALAGTASRAAATLRSFTVDAGVDVVTFGGTKNGLLGAEAVVFLEVELAARAKYLRKTSTQLSSKMRFLAAQFLALLDGDLWYRNAAAANEMAMRLYSGVASLPDVTVAAPAVNSLFPVLPADSAHVLRNWSFFWDWEPSIGQVRWMTSWDTTGEDIERFVAGVTCATSPAIAAH